MAKDNNKKKVGKDLFKRNTNQINQASKPPRSRVGESLENERQERQEEKQGQIRQEVNTELFNTKAHLNFTTNAAFKKRFKFAALSNNMKLIEFLEYLLDKHENQ